MLLLIPSDVLAKYKGNNKIISLFIKLIRIKIVIHTDFYIYKTKLHKCIQKTGLYNIVKL